MADKRWQYVRGSQLWVYKETRNRWGKSSDPVVKQRKKGAWYISSNNSQEPWFGPFIDRECAQIMAYIRYERPDEDTA